MTPHDLTFRGCRVHSWTSGPAGAPWLVVSHGGGLDHTSFRPLAARLSDRWRVLLWDLPGHGESQPMPQPFTAALCAEALAALVDHAGVERAVHLGFSFGGVVAQLFARARPAQVTGLIAYACFTPHLSGPGLSVEAAVAAVDAAFGRLSWPDTKAVFAALCSTRPEVQADVAAAMEGVGCEGFLAMARALLIAADPAPDFRIEAPVLILGAALDSNGATLVEAQDALQAACRNAMRVVIRAAGHCAHQDAPEAFATAVERFLATVPSNAGGERSHPGSETTS